MDDDFLSVVFLVGVFLFGLFIGLVFFGRDSLEASHKALGSYGHACFANHTCRDGLRCLHGDGAEPGTCVK